MGLRCQLYCFHSNDAPVSPVDANDAPVSPVDASANANHAAVMQMICMYLAESTIHRMSDPLK